MRMKSDADIIRDAKLEAMGLPPEEEHHRPHHQRSQMATDEMVSGLLSTSDVKTKHRAGHGAL